ncbi:hypothetical protein TOPH_05351 [Tolypocladium ophioglossoides CBS 100239]|uniref:N-acetyltransferase domain-containing protein n=1 Tax=Tolypocladium ophioglossoides (strain CBS 100239) TaxID=1163406 RepID=A0A0L0N7M5_TOLOC|nr:hypothetical protein TOPH_05351 [Tolypocladium ophioglossoides CBS 100239]
MFTTRPATAADVPLLPAVERSAAEAFKRIPDLAWVADDDGQSEQRHLELIQGGVSWVAVNDASDAPLGFLNGQLMGGNLHIWEMSVGKDHQGKGIGRGLMNHARRWATSQDLLAITLTTFRDVPWNDKFYASMGFTMLSSSELTPALKRVLGDAVRDGFPGEKRCAMRLLLR